MEEQMNKWSVLFCWILDVKKRTGFFVPSAAVPLFLLAPRPNIFQTSKQISSNSNDKGVGEKKEITGTFDEINGKRSMVPRIICKGSEMSTILLMSAHF